MLKSLPLRVLNPECEPVRNQIKGGVFILSVTAVNSREREMIESSGLYPDKALGHNFFHKQTATWNQIDKESTVIEQIILPKNLQV